MMHRLTAILCICFANMMLLHFVSQWCDVCPYVPAGTHHSRSEHHWARPTSFAEGKHHWKKHLHCRCFFLAEGVGFEPTWAQAQTVFKTASLWPLRYPSMIENIKFSSIDAKLSSQRLKYFNTNMFLCQVISKIYFSKNKITHKMPKSQKTFKIYKTSWNIA